MKKVLPLLFVTLFWAAAGQAQNELAPDQNPNYAVSRSKYMGLADSLIAYHGTTVQDTYRAIDWMADRAEARAERRDFRRQLRLIRAQNWYGNYYPGFNNGWRNYRYPFWRGNSLTLSPWGGRYWW